MSTLRELMGDLKRGDGRKFTYSAPEFGEFFEPIFLDIHGNWSGLDEDGDTGVFSDEGIGWIPYTEPKKKVKLYKWVYHKPGFYRKDSIVYAATEKDMRKILSIPNPNAEDMTFIRLDYSMIEVDDDN